MGFAHPDYLIEKLTASQLAEWQAYDRLDPIGEARDDFRMSYLASTITNLAISINGKKGAKLTEVKDFLLDWDRDKPNKGTQSIEDMKAVFMGIAAANNKKETKRDNKRIPKSLQK